MVGKSEAAVSTRRVYTFQRNNDLHEQSTRTEILFTRYKRDHSTCGQRATCMVVDIDREREVGRV